jgi:signal transduction histidine kinase
LIRAKKADNIDSLLAGMNTGINRLRIIVDDMIDVSMIDNNLLQLNFQPMQIHQMLDVLQNEVKNTLHDRKLTLERKSFEGSREWIYIDPVRMKQALRNVIHNAIKFTPDGGVITIDGRILPGFIELTIADTGIGISLENQPLIFEKFEQLGRVDLHSSGKTKFKGGGPGLGLPIARGVLEAHGGSIWVESPGYDEKACPGTTFHILIPSRTQAPDPKMTELFDVLGKKK